MVEQPLDVLAIERSGGFKGRYHVLHGFLNPIDGVGPEDIHVRELVTRLQDGEVQEVIMATNPSLEGEATAMYVQRLLTPPVSASRGSRAASQAARISNTPTTSRSRAPSRAGEEL